MKKPLVSIIIPVYNDEQYIGRAIESCINQTLDDIEIIVVDDASTDRSVEVIEEYILKDDRIRLIQQPKNLSALQARRVGIVAADTDHILFLDGDDELSSEVASLCYKKAVSHDADVVGFRLSVIKPDGVRARRFEESFRSKKGELWNINIVRNLFKPWATVHGSLCGYMFSKDLLLKSYRHIPKNKTAYRSNDIMITLVALSFARHYVSVPDRLYTYYLGIGSSGHENIGYDKFVFYAQSIQSIESVEAVITNKNFSKDDLEVVRRCYESARLSVISRVLRYCIDHLELGSRQKGMNYLLSKVSAEDLLMAVAAFCPDSLAGTLKFIKYSINNIHPKNVMIHTHSMGIGGLQGVVLSQARHLLNAGYQVTILLLKSSGQLPHNVPDGVTLITLPSGATQDKMISFVELLKRHRVDIIIDHNILYNNRWPFFMALAKLQGLKTIGWLHSFALRPAHDMNRQGSFLSSHLDILDSVVTLSGVDVSYWKMLGHSNVYYLPNPPSPLLMENDLVDKPKKLQGNRLNLIWYGRLQQQTKQLYSLIEVAARLSGMTSNFHLKVVGPDGLDISIEKLKSHIRKMGLDDKVSVVGAKHGKDLVAEIKKADIFLLTSDIEGYPLVITEAQSFGLPVVMYELPWLAVLKDNEGIFQVVQRDARAMAREIHSIYQDKKRYAAASKASIEAARNYLSYDFPKLYDQLLQGKLPSKYSPDPGAEDMKMIIEWYNRYVEKNSKEVQSKIERLNEKHKLEIEQIKQSLSYRLGEFLALPVRKIKSIKK